MRDDETKAMSPNVDNATQVSAGEPVARSVVSGFISQAKPSTCTDSIASPLVKAHQEAVDLRLSPDSNAEAKSEQSASDSEYILCAVVWHVGTQAGSGHYLADVRQPGMHGRPTVWKRYDDALVRPIGEESPDLLGNGYMYFYVHHSLVM